MLRRIPLIITILLLSACASWIPKPHETPSPDIVFIHDNPSVGDYAVYGQRGGGVIHRYEVFEASGKEITIRYRVQNTDPDINEMSPKEWYYRKLDRQGNVIKAWAETDDGKYFNTPVAKTGGIGSFEHLTPVNKKIKRPMATKAGAFNVDAINTYIYRQDAGLISINSSCMEYYSDKVPFKVLKREMLHTADTGAFLKTTEYINVIGDVYLTDNYMKLYNKATEGDMKYQTTLELLEYGFAR